MQLEIYRCVVPVAGLHRVVSGKTELWEDDSGPAVRMRVRPASPVEEDVLHHRVEGHGGPGEEVAVLPVRHDVPLGGDDRSSRHS